MNSAKSDGAESDKAERWQILEYYLRILPYFF